MTFLIASTFDRSAGRGESPRGAGHSWRHPADTATSGPEPRAYAKGRGCRKQDGVGVNNVRVTIPPVHVCAPLKGLPAKGANGNKILWMRHMSMISSRGSAALPLRCPCRGSQCRSFRALAWHRRPESQDESAVAFVMACPTLLLMPVKKVSRLEKTWP